jgi:hypothetical protein
MEIGDRMLSIRLLPAQTRAFLPTPSSLGTANSPRSAGTGPASTRACSSHGETDSRGGAHTRMRIVDFAFEVPPWAVA